ncbi:hypothetical protein Tco_1024036 [Tanacetum coccineum]
MDEGEMRTCLTETRRALGLDGNVLGGDVVGRDRGYDCSCGDQDRYSVLDFRGRVNRVTYTREWLVLLRQDIMEETTDLELNRVDDIGGT